MVNIIDYLPGHSDIISNSYLHMYIFPGLKLELIDRLSERGMQSFNGIALSPVVWIMVFTFQLTIL